MAKVPRAGNVKTRLQPFLSPDECETLAEAFLKDAIVKARPLCDDLVIAFAPAAESDYFAGFDAENLILHEQCGADLGEKMLDVFEFAYQRNSAAKVLIIGTDSPTFPHEFLSQAFGFLEYEFDAVLGKSADGGFYLLGLREIKLNLFDNIEWSSPSVYGQITRNIERLKISLKEIGDWYDVDTPDDLQRLRAEISKNKAARKIAPLTFQWFQLNAKQQQIDGRRQGD